MTDRHMNEEDISNKRKEDSLQKKISTVLQDVAQEARELYLDKVVPEKQVMNPLQFYRDYVAPNKPVLFRDAVSHWPALQKWCSKYFREVLGDVEVTVAVTPNGYADAVTDGKFVMPEERKMTMADFLDVLDRPDQYHGVFYIQKQNSNLTDEFRAIIPDVETEILWASEAFGKKPDAVNFWMGDGRAVTSMHRDHYENLYCVVKGYKTFCLLPPTDLPFIPYEMYQAANFKEVVPGEFQIIDDEETGKIPWIALDPCNPDLNKYPDFAHAHPVEVTVHAGQMLYLPSLWFHHVRQSHGCVAVNFWYDMEFDIKYNYYKFLESVSSAVS